MGGTILSYVIPVCVHEAKVGFTYECEDGDFVENCIDPETVHEDRDVSFIVVPFQRDLFFWVELEGLEVF
jgi:hypothetical protein